MSVREKDRRRDESSVRIKSHTKLDFIAQKRAVFHAHIKIFPLPAFSVFSESVPGSESLRASGDSHFLPAVVASDQQASSSGRGPGGL